MFNLFLLCHTSFLNARDKIGFISPGQKQPLQGQIVTNTPFT